MKRPIMGNEGLDAGNRCGGAKDAMAFVGAGCLGNDGHAPLCPSYGVSGCKWCWFLWGS